MNRRSFLARSGWAAACVGGVALGGGPAFGGGSGPGGATGSGGFAPPAASGAVARAAAGVARTDADRREWEIFRRRFTNPDGRIIDTGNNDVSHTEGQGWGLLFAAAFDDPASFEHMRSWTFAHLRRPDDALHAWRYAPGAGVPVADLNNATDGDLFIACALWRAANRWNRADYAAQARAIARDILRLLVREAGGRALLLPAAAGFEAGGAIVVNPSYYAFIAMRELAEAVPSPLWGRVAADGLALIGAGRFGAWRLPPDWLSVSLADGALAPAPGFPARFSYDAVRVPLHLKWAGLTQPAVQAAFDDFWHETTAPVAWVDLTTDDRASYPAPPGVVAVAKIATASQKTALPDDFPSIRSSPDYYSAALTLLARLAWQEIMLV